LQRNKRDLVESSARVAALIQGLNLEALANGAVVIVEGKRDEKALRAMGYNGPLIKVMSSGLSLQRIASRIGARYTKAILLLDYDRQGEKLSARLRMLLEREGIDVDDEARENILGAVEGTIKGVEELIRFAGIAGSQGDT